MAVMEVLEKSPWEERYMTVDMSGSLRDSGDTIASVDSVTVEAQGDDSPTAVTVSSIEFTDEKVAFVAKGGEAGALYTVTVRVVTASTPTPAQKLEGAVKLIVRDPPT